MSDQKFETMDNVVIETTDHSLIRLYDRYNFKTYAHIIGSEDIDDEIDKILLYPDINGSNVYYHNLIPTGFVVLRRTESNKFVVISVTENEHRNYGNPIILVNPILRERQSEYES